MDLKNMATRRFKKRLPASMRKVFATTGFTLIEVVVALAILGIGLTVIFELFSGGLRLASISQEYSVAVNYGRMKMEEIAFQSKVEEGDEEGQFDENFRWKVAIQKVDILPAEKDTDFKPPVELFQITVNIIWKSGSQERSATFESYRASKLEDEKV